jgi:hypothetical protein
MVIPVLNFRLSLGLDGLEQCPLGHTPLGKPLKGGVPVARLAPDGPGRLGVRVLSRSVSKEKVYSESPVLLEHGESDGMCRDKRSSEPLHSVVVDEAFGLDGLHGEVEGGGGVDLDTTVGEKRAKKRVSFERRKAWSKRGKSSPKCDDELVSVEHTKLQVVLRVADCKTEAISELDPQ